ncbi:putative disease resistance protein [Capsicum annuum]
MKLPVVTSFYNPLKDVWLYLKGRRRHIIDLDDNSRTLNLRRENLLAMEEQIEGKLRFKKKNKKYDVLGRQIQDITRKHEQIESKLNKSDGSSSTQVTTNENLANRGEGGTSLTQVETNENLANRGGEGSIRKKNKKGNVLGRQIQAITRRYKKIRSRFKKSDGNSSIQVATNENVANEGEDGTSSTQVATNENVANEGEDGTSSTQVATNENVANGGEDGTSSTQVTTNENLANRGEGGTSSTQVDTNENVANRKEGGTSLTQVETNENVARGGEGSISSTQVAQNQQIARRKIWNRKFFQNARLDKDAVKLTGEINALKIEDVKLETLVTEEIYVQRENAPTRDFMPLWRHVEKILEYLENASTKRIGIYGEAQVGKSTVLKMLNNCFYPTLSSISLTYDAVIWVDFPSKDSEDAKKNMQLQILRSIYGKEEQSSRHNATRINEALENAKYLLILDDVYEKVDLAGLGIHDDHKFGQVVIGATGKGVLNLMKVHESILIEKLECHDAEEFFKECLGLESGVDLSLVQPYMKKIIELTGGHIGALVGIANFMKGLGTYKTNLSVWSAVVLNLQLPNSPQKLELGALEKAYKLSYDALKDDDMKKCLLYVALFPVGYRAHTSYLVECWKAEDFLQDYNTFKEARAIGYTICCKLTETHLLEWSGEEHLKMPLIFRKVALQIQYPGDVGENKILVRNILERGNHPSEQDWNTAKRISLMCGELDSDFLPNCPMYSNKLTLLLQKNPKLRDIGDQFFINMGNLRVLDLQRTGIIGLPKSISALGHLKCLYLNDCSSLGRLPTEMEKLNQLELLDIRRTLMRCLPREIWYLKTLRCLLISVCDSLHSKKIMMVSQPSCFSREFFLKLKFLEELTIDVDPLTPDKRLTVDQIQEVLREAVHQHYLNVTWEPNEFIALTATQSNREEITTINNLKHANQLEITEASTSTTNSQHTEGTKEWVQKRFHDN